ncbi:thiamine-binding protein, partial [candidate division KSB1 bacterium]|nr:thiamine-binding protein [candidate division KSB1 bacterium]
ADLMPIIEASGLDFKLGAMQTTVEGDEPAVMDVIMACHRKMKEVAPRVLTSITIDDRSDATNRLEGKVIDVEALLNREIAHE